MIQDMVDQGVETPVEAEAPPESPAAPIFQILTPDVTPEEIVALATVLGAMSGGEDEEPSGPRPQWGVPARSVRHVPAPATGGWMLSRLP